MSIKSKVLATAATLALVGGVGTAGVLGTAATAANAATPSCGSTCVDIFSQEFGHHKDPGYILDVFQQHVRIGQPIILYRSSNNDPAEDFRLEFQGTVADFYAAAMVSSALALHYGCLTTLGNSGIGNFPDCFGFDEDFNDPAFEIEYTPDGVDSGLCVGVASHRDAGGGREPAGVRRVVEDGLGRGHLRPPIESFFQHYYPLINGSDTNFSQPYVLTYPQSGYPTDKPRPVLQVDNLSGYTTGFPPILNYPSIDDNQMWGADFGPYLFEN